MRILYASDLHGDPGKYAAVIDLARAGNPAACILGGDLFAFNRYQVQQRHQGTMEFLRGFFHALAVPAFAIAGNLDFPLTMAGLAELQGEGLVTVLEHRPAQINARWNLYGYPCVPPTPFRKKDFERRDLANDAVKPRDGSYATRADGTMRRVGPAYFNRLPSIEEELARFLPASPALYVTHTPPADTGLDMVQDGRHIGSVALRSHLLQHQPMLALHGHVHESPHVSSRWAERLGSTWCVNPGQHPKVLYAVMMEVDDHRVISLVHTHFGTLAMGESGGSNP